MYEVVRIRNFYTPYDFLNPVMKIRIGRLSAIRQVESKKVECL